MSGRKDLIVEMITEHDIDDSPVEAHQNLALNQSQEIAEINRPNHAAPELQRFVWSHCINLGLKVFFAALSIPWFISVIIFSIFDTKCIVFEQASVINCSQGLLISNPKNWVFAWLFMSILATFVLIAIIWLNHEKMNYQSEKAKKIHGKGSFWSLIFLLIVTSGYYVFRVFSRSDELGRVISVLIVLWSPVTVLAVCCLNYLPRVQWNAVTPRCTPQWWKECLTGNSNFFIYWLALVKYFVELTCTLAAVMLDVSHEVAPLIQKKFPEESGQFWGVMVIVLGFGLAFHARLLSFFWQKLFHGEKDLLSEPSSKLVDEREDQLEVQQNGEEFKNIEMEEIICTGKSRIEKGYE